MRTDQVQNLQAVLSYKQVSIPCNLDVTFVEAPEESIRIRANLTYGNKEIFDLI